MKHEEVLEGIGKIHVKIILYSWKSSLARIICCKCRNVVDSEGKWWEIISEIELKSLSRETLTIHLSTWLDYSQHWSNAQGWLGFDANKSLQTSRLAASSAWTRNCQLLHLCSALRISTTLLGFISTLPLPAQLRSVLLWRVVPSLCFDSFPWRNCQVCTLPPPPPCMYLTTSTSAL